jgi:hypothetical protein
VLAIWPAHAIITNASGSRKAIGIPITVMRSSMHENSMSGVETRPRKNEATPRREAVVATRSMRSGISSVTSQPAKIEISQPMKTEISSMGSGGMPNAVGRKPSDTLSPPTVAPRA